MQKELIYWYNQNKRNLPWRKTNNPYNIWISEIMLQQTTVEAVIPYYLRFMKRFPTIKELAKANEEEVYKYWEGLGYYRRAKHILETAQILHKQYHDQFPDDYQTILSLKGIGPYTAGAISSIAFSKEIAAIDGNVLRIISRTHLISDNIALTTTQKNITEIVNKLIQGYNPSSFNQGLMDLGATICRPKNPKCEICPINHDCKAYLNNQQNVLPINTKKIKHQEIHFITGIITHKNHYMFIKNKKGLLENLYGLIQYECQNPYDFIQLFKNEYHIDLEVVSYIKDIKHIFTHRTWIMHTYHFILKEPNGYLYNQKEMEKIPISTAHQKVLTAYFKEN